MSRNELRSIRQQGCGRIDRAWNFSASWVSGAVCGINQGHRTGRSSLSGDDERVTWNSSTAAIPVRTVMRVARGSAACRAAAGAELKLRWTPPRETCAARREIANLIVPVFAAPPTFMPAPGIHRRPAARLLATRRIGKRLVTSLNRENGHARATRAARTMALTFG